jgi:hypothetical protein
MAIDPRLHLKKAEELLTEAAFGFENQGVNYLAKETTKIKKKLGSLLSCLDLKVDE